jgi:hypothetical protein
MHILEKLPQMMLGKSYNLSAQGSNLNNTSAKNSFEHNATRELTELRDELANYGQMIEQAEFTVCILTSLLDSWVSGIKLTKITNSLDIVIPEGETQLRQNGTCHLPEKATISIAIMINQ